MYDKALKLVNGLFITNPINIRYLTGFVGVAPEEREAFVLVTSEQTYLFTNSLYMEEAKKLLNIKLIQISQSNPISKELARICKELKIKKLGFEELNLTVAELTKLRQELTGMKLIPTQNRIEELRMIKRKDEIENIKLAANITDQCFKFITRRIRAGATESRLAWEIESFCNIKAGDMAFSPIVAFNDHSAMPHYHARSSNPLRKGSLILLDFGARVNGYCADMTRVVFLGPPNDKWAKAYKTILTANEKALELLKNGERNGATLDASAKEVIAEADLPPYSHSLGHAVGLAIHEAPRLTVKKTETLMSNMIVSVEPAVYIEGSYGVRIEDLVLLKEKSLDVLSKSPKELIVL